MPAITRGSERINIPYELIENFVNDGWVIDLVQNVSRSPLPLQPVSESQEQIFTLIKTHYLSNQRKSISLGTKLIVLKKTCETPQEGWAKILNLMRTFIKLKKSHAMDKAKKGWIDVNHDIEYLFRAMGLGYNSDGLPTIFNQLKPKFPKEPLSNVHGRATIEVSDRKAFLIGKAIQSIINDPKCYKELSEHRGTLLAVAEDMITVGTRRDSRTSLQRERIFQLGLHPHIYIFYKHA